MWSKKPRPLYRFDESLKMFNKLICEYPDYIDGLDVSGTDLHWVKKIFMKRGELDNFVALLVDIINEYVDKTVAGYALVELGSSLASQKKYASALENYEEVKKKFTKSPLLIEKAEQGIEKIYRKEPALKQK